MARGRTPPSPADLDHLYQVRLGEFTSARNDLARRVDDAAAIRRIQKPNLPAWAVNQLYWQRREAWDRLVEAAGRAQAAHRKRLSGRGGDVEVAENEHRAAVRSAADDIRGLLRAADEMASAATLPSVIETLQALPGSAQPGRLSRPLKPMGLEALVGLVPTGLATLRTVAPKNPSGPREAPAERRSKMSAARSIPESNHGAPPSPRCADCRLKSSCR
jgi:hypothetical protein